VPELGVDHGLALAEVGPDQLGVAVLVPGVPVEVDADDVEQAPVDHLERERGVGERPVEHLPDPVAGFGEEGLELRRVPAGPQARLPDVRDALAGRPARDDPPGEQAGLGTHAEDQPAGELLAQRLGGRGRLGQVGDGRLAALPEQFRGEPDLQAAELQRVGGRGHQPADVGALEPDRVAVQIVPDDPQLTAGGRRVEDLPGQEPVVVLAPHVVAHALDVHALPRSAPLS
jgi:hypothetical protein